ncbi:hypothetical protein AAMO2058_001704300 [Amorphochlora amoebiformis]
MPPKSKKHMKMTFSNQVSIKKGLKACPPARWTRKWVFIKDNYFHDSDVQRKAISDWGGRYLKTTEGKQLLEMRVRIHGKAAVEAADAGATEDSKAAVDVSAGAEAESLALSADDIESEDDPEEEEQLFTVLKSKPPNRYEDVSVKHNRKERKRKAHPIVSVDDIICLDEEEPGEYRILNTSHMRPFTLVLTPKQHRKRPGIVYLFHLGSRERITFDRDLVTRVVTVTKKTLHIQPKHIRKWYEVATANGNGKLQSQSEWVMKALACTERVSGREYAVEAAETITSTFTVPKKYVIEQNEIIGCGGGEYAGDEKMVIDDYLGSEHYSLGSSKKMKSS